MLHVMETHLGFPECLDTKKSQMSPNELSGLVTVKFTCYHSGLYRPNRCLLIHGPKSTASLKLQCMIVL